MNDLCIFCQITAGQAPRSLVYEDELVIGIMDLYPVTPGHLMVIPRRHFSGLEDLEVATGKHMFAVAQRFAAALRESGLRCEGINLFLADGEAAFQEIFHVHLHVIPRFNGDPFKISADWGVKPSRAELDRHAGQIEAAYRRLWN